jgi:2,3-bisphosphoglycerate-independent phosphoglycerate mutase
MTAAGAGSAGRPRPVVLVVLDGFGIGHEVEKDAIAQAHMPNYIELLQRWPHSSLQASEEFVGLPEGQMGNSEVGHLNLGTGQPVLQDLPRIDKSISSGGFFSRPVLLELCKQAKDGDHTLHLISLVGPGGVHANDRHLVAVAEMAAKEGVKRVRIHGLLDGRDTPPRSAIEYVPDLESRLKAAHPDAKIATIGGRYFAMDRDKRWERVQKGYDAIVHGVADQHAASAVAAVEGGYARGENDEFITPTVIDGVDHGQIADGDSVLHCNFRADRARQLAHALADPDFAFFDRNASGPMPKGVLVSTMTSYESNLPVQVVFGPEEVPSLAGGVSKAGWKQFHVAETEKYAHVTYFFNGGREEPWPGEDRQLVPSIKTVATYDLQPTMAAAGVCDAIIAAIEGGKYDLIVANFANPDMVGHTGVWEATIKACETVDSAIGRVSAAVLAVDAGDPSAPGAVLLITADHGNADEMKDEAGNPVTKHSLNPVPLLAIGRYMDGKRLKDGRLADVTPTILEMGGLEAWPDVTGHSLLAES